MVFYFYFLLVEGPLERPEYPFVFWLLQWYLSGLKLVSKVVHERQSVLLGFSEVCEGKRTMVHSFSRAINRTDG